MTQRGETATTEQRSKHRKTRLRIITVAVIVLLLVALVLTPPYVNVNRYRRRITTTMSQSLGRPVHLDNVTLHLLPVPGLTLSNLVVSEDPAFGYEPVIRANTVEATLRASSLWRRHIEFSTIRFIEPSVNLVRNAQGRWNLEDVLMQASHVETAPTAQRIAGSAPRFPYIEATGARVNLKIGDEKKPFSLTETQFALWLPSPQTWRVRLRGRPTRTDNNVSQTGEVTLEGTLQRAQKMSDVPLDMYLNWNGSPLGEASRLLTGNDAGWRGTAFFETHVLGTVSSANVTTHLQLNDLRRSDFVPAQPLDVTVDCSSLTDVAKATLTNVTCAAPVGDSKPLTLSAASVDLEKPANTQAKVIAANVPLAWGLQWAKLFMPQMPAALTPAGSVNGEINWNGYPAGWQGTMTVALQSPSDQKLKGDAPSFVFAVNSAQPNGAGTPTPAVKLAPTALHPQAGSTLTVSGTADANGYGVQLTGTGTNAQVLALADALPPLNEGLQPVLASSTGTTPHAISLSCSRLWGGEQACVEATQPQTAAKTSRPKRRR